jgi:hypothetical protein
LLDFVLEWRHGVQYHGERYVRGVFLLNAVAMSAAWALIYTASRRGRFATTLLAHVWVVGWLVWLAFPWLGELILNGRQDR